MGKHTIDPQISAEHLAGAVRFATVSNADNSLTDYTKFDAFHEYLKETYPLVHKHLTLEHTGQAGLLYHWKGTGKSGAAPLLLMAHQDVVPEGDLEKWTYPPKQYRIKKGSRRVKRRYSNSECFKSTDEVYSITNTRVLGYIVGEFIQYRVYGHSTGAS